ncbi:MAG: hypothetical protein QXL67_05245 [Candidatus Bathyarchaeia archaeon]
MGDAMRGSGLQHLIIVVLIALILILSSFSYILWQGREVERQLVKQLEAKNQELRQQMEAGEVFGIALIIIENTSIPLLPQLIPYTPEGKQVPFLGDIALLTYFLNESREADLSLSNYKSHVESFNKTYDVKASRLVMERKTGYAHVILENVIINLTTTKRSLLYDFEVAELYISTLKGDSLYIRGYLRNLNLPTKAGYRMHL